MLEEIIKKKEKKSFTTYPFWKFHKTGNTQSIFFGLSCLGVINYWLGNFVVVSNWHISIYFTYLWWNREKTTNPTALQAATDHLLNYVELANDTKQSFSTNTETRETELRNNSQVLLTTSPRDSEEEESPRIPLQMHQVHTHTHSCLMLYVFQLNMCLFLWVCHICS